MNWLLVVLIVLAVFLVVWVTAAVIVRRHRPPRELAVPAVRIMPDILVLARRLGDEPGMPRGSRIGLFAVRVWLVSPIDLIPDFLPAVGHLDDLIIAIAVLRRVLPRLEPARLGELWPGTPDGLLLFARLLEGRVVTETRPPEPGPARFPDAPDAAAAPDPDPPEPDHDAAPEAEAASIPPRA